MHRKILTVLIASTLTWSCASTAAWKDSSGNLIPDTESRRTVGDFGGSLVLTTDPDWEQKWNTSPESVPHFSEKSGVSEGEKLFALIFIANPKLNDLRESDVTCDLKVSQPDGAPVVEQKAVVVSNNSSLGRRIVFTSRHQSSRSAGSLTTLEDFGRCRLL